MTDPCPELPAHTDPLDEAPWALQLVVRREKASPPAHTAVCEAAALAVVALLTDDRARRDWAPAIRRWTAGRIRKHVRRARGARWQQVQQLPGVTVTHDGAEVRAFVPCATDEVPRDVARLQLSGIDLEDPAATAHHSPATGALVVSLPAVPRLVTGKAAAACGHAAQLALAAMPDERRQRWRDVGHRVLVEQPSAARFRELVDDAPVVVVDAGLTEVPSGSTTSVARWW